MTRRDGSPPSGRELAESWQQSGRHLIWVYGRAAPMLHFEMERQALYQELETACEMLQLAGDDIEKTRVVLSIVEIRARSLVNDHAGRLLRVLIHGARRCGV